MTNSDKMQRAGTATTWMASAGLFTIAVAIMPTSARAQAGANAAAPATSQAADDERAARNDFVVT